MSLEYLEIKIISANLESFEGFVPTSYIELEWLPGDITRALGPNSPVTPEDAPENIART